jgi:hypothetical protein
MAEGQIGAANAPVNSMGIGVSSTRQRAASGNTFLSLGERALRKTMGPLSKDLKAKKKKKVKGKKAKDYEEELRALLEGTGDNLVMPEEPDNDVSIE